MNAVIADYVISGLLAYMHMIVHGLLRTNCMGETRLLRLRAPISGCGLRGVATLTSCPGISFPKVDNYAEVSGCAQCY